MFVHFSGIASTFLTSGVRLTASIARGCTAYFRGGTLLIVEVVCPFYCLAFERTHCAFHLVNFQAKQFRLAGLSQPMFPAAPWQSWGVSRPGKIDTNPNLLSGALGSDRKSDIIEIAAEISSSCWTEFLELWDLKEALSRTILPLRWRKEPLEVKWASDQDISQGLPLEVFQVGPNGRRPQGTPTQSVPSPWSSPYPSHPTKKQISVACISDLILSITTQSSRWKVRVGKSKALLTNSAFSSRHATCYNIPLHLVYAFFFGRHFDRQMIQSMATIHHFPRISKAQRNASFSDGTWLELVFRLVLKTMSTLIWCHSQLQLPRWMQRSVRTESLLILFGSPLLFLQNVWCKKKKKRPISRGKWKLSS